MTRGLSALCLSCLVLGCSNEKAHPSVPARVDGGARDANARDASTRDSGTTDPLRLSPLHAAPDPANGGTLVDDDGRTVLLRGVNVNALAEYWKGTDYPTVFPLTDADIDVMATIGWNAVRLLVSWSRVEPNPGAYDEAYLASVDDAIARFGRRGIYSIVDLHQDAWGATLAGRPNEACPSRQQPAFGWDGAPGWATLDGNAARCTAGLRELSPAVLAAWTAFFADAPGPESVGIRTRYAKMLGALSRRYANEPAVAGYDVMNEPNAFGADEGRALSDLYARALVEIRAGEQAASGTPHLVLFEPPALWSTTGSGPPPDFARDRDVVYAPHLYTGGFSSGPITRAAFDVALTEAAGFGGAPILSGEWGSGPDRASNPADGYFVTHQTLEDEVRISATLWTWRESCGDPHHAGDYRAGNTPTVWGEFDVDCASNTVNGLRADLVAQLTRAYVRAAPGALTETHYDLTTGAFRASGRATSPGALLVAFYPAARHGSPHVVSTGLSDVDTVDGPGGNAYLVGRSRGGAWSITVGPSGG